MSSQMASPRSLPPSLLEAALSPQMTGRVDSRGPSQPLASTSRSRTGRSPLRDGTENATGRHVIARFHVVLAPHHVRYCPSGKCGPKAISLLWESGIDA